MKNFIVSQRFILAWISGYFLQRLFVELGRALFALFTGNNVAEVAINIISGHIQIVAENPATVWIAALGPFVLPVLFALLMEVFKGDFMKTATAVVLGNSAAELFGNALAVLFVQDLTDYELGIFVVGSGLDRRIVSAVALFLVVIMGWCAFEKIKKVIENLKK